MVLQQSFFRVPPASPYLDHVVAATPAVLTHMHPCLHIHNINVLGARRMMQCIKEVFSTGKLGTRQAQQAPAIQDKHV